MSVASETIIAVPYRFIIDWNTFQIVALWVRIGLSKKKIILWQDIQEISNAWYVQSEDAFSDPEDLVRLEETLKNFFNIKGAVCKTLDGDVLGKVSDCTFTVQTGQITQFMIKNYTLRDLAHELALPINVVKKVEDKTIFIDDLEKKSLLPDTQAVILPATNYV